MYMRDYQHEAIGFAVYPTDEVGVLYPFMGLAEEAGEVLGKVAKAVRLGAPPLAFERREALVAELGDVLWMLAACCREVDVTLDEVAEHNLKKLRSRKSRNVIAGEGDCR